MWTVHAYDKNLVRLGAIDVWSELDITVRFNAGGVWSLTLPGDHPQSDLISATTRLRFSNGPIRVSGPVRGMTQASQDGSPTPLIKVTGVDDTGVLADRLTYPDPGNESWAQTTAYYTPTGPAETVVRGLISNNLGPGAIVSRRALGWVDGTDTGLGATVKVSARFSNLLEECRAAAVGVGFEVTYLKTGVTPVVYTPRDLTTEIVLSTDIGNLRAWSWGRNSPQGTRALIAGQGEGAARVIRERSTTVEESDWNVRVEAFLDARDTPETDLLDQRGDEWLVENAATAGLAITPIDLPGSVFGVDYYLGDKVTVEVRGVRYSDVITQTRILVNGSGESMSPTVGDREISGDTPLLYKRVKDLMQRVDQLERRQ